MSDLKNKIEAPRIDWFQNQQTIKDLTAIYNILEQRGWIQGMLGRWGGPRCLRGALYEVVDGALSAGSQDRFHRILTALCFSEVGYLVQYNDAPGRTKQQVLDRIRLARDMLA